MIKRLLKGNELLKHVLVLLQGTVIAQVIAVLMQLVLRRMFTVSDFGIVTLYASTIGVLSILASGRYEMAIVLPKEDRNAKAIFRISLILSFLFNAVLFIALLFLSDAILELIFENELVDPAEVSNPEYIKYLIYCVPLGVFIMTLYNSFNYLFTREKRYKELSRSRIYQAVTANGVNAGFGAAQFGFIGLFIGYLLGFATSFIFLFLSKSGVLKAEAGDTRENLKKHIDFPAKSVPSGLLNMLALQLPNFFIFSFFGASILGVFDIITRVLNMPITMIGRSVSQVFYQKVAEDYKNGKPIGGYVKKFSIRLFLFMLVPMSVIFFFGEPIFAFIFGEEYRISGKLATYFSLFFLIRFVYYSQSTIFSAVGELGVEFRQNIIFIISQLGALIIGCYYLNDFEWTFILLALSGAACYLYFTFSLIRIAQKADT